MGGIERVAYEQCRRLQKRGYELVILTSQLTGNNGYEIDGLKVYCYPIYKVGFTRGIPYVVPKPRALQVFDKLIQHCDLVHAHGHPYLSSYLAAKTAKKYSKPLILTQHNTFIDYGGFWNLAEGLNDAIVGRNSLGLSDRIIVVSKATMKYVLSLGADPEKIRLLYNGVDVDNFKPLNLSKKGIRKELGYPQNCFIVFTVRRLVYKNGIDCLLEAARIAVKENPRLLFLVAGTGPDYKKITAKMREYSLEENFRLLGFVSDDLLPKYYCLSDVFALPSKSGEGLPLVLLEAMACSLPVISTDVGGASEIINEQVGRIIPPNCAEAFAEALLAFANMDLAHYRREARKLVEEHYSWEKNVERLVEIYEELI